MFNETLSSASQPRVPVSSYVIWTSQAGGFRNTKRGIVIAHIPPMQSAFAHLPLSLPKSRRKFDTDEALTNYGHRVLIAVPRGKGYDYYCPRLSIVQLAPP